MATTQLSLYNEALLLVGERELTTVTDDIEVRYRLDTAYENGPDFCFELIKPVFSRKTSKLTTFITSPVHGYDNVFTLPSDFIDIVEVYSDEKLDQPINRFIMEGGTLACNYSSIFLRYISNAYALALWDKSFERAVVAYLAREIVARVAPDETERVEATFNTRVEQAMALRQSKEPTKRSSDEGATLTTPMRKIYNQALQILGLDEINDNNDDSDRKVKLDVALSADLVESLLEDTGWHWAITTLKMQANPSLEPDWGFGDVYDKPDDMHRLDGVFQDEFLQVPLKRYKDEGEHIFTEVTELYLQFVSKSYISDPVFWPPHFRRLVGAAMAKDAAMALRVDPLIAEARYEEYLNNAKNIDIIQSPPRRLANGEWTSSRFAGNYYRGRP